MTDQHSKRHWHHYLRFSTLAATIVGTLSHQAHGSLINIAYPLSQPSTTGI